MRHPASNRGLAPRLRLQNPAMPSDAIRPRRSWRLLAGVGLLLVLLALSPFLPLAAWATACQQAAQATGFWGAIVFVLVFAAWNMLLPPLPLQLIAGCAWGVAGGFAVVFAGSTLAMLAGFGLARRLGRKRLEPWLARRRVLAAVDRAVDAEGWKAVFLLRLAGCVPSNLLNIAFGLTRLSLATVMLVGWLGKTPGVLLSVLVGAGADFSAGAPAGLGRWTWISVVFALAATVTVVVVLARRTRAVLAAEDEVSRAEAGAGAGPG